MCSIIYSLGVLILRVGLGGLMIAHGIQKFKIILSGGASKWLDPIGLGASTSLYLATFSELLCSLLLIVGLFTRASAFILAFTMFVAAFIFLKNSTFAGRELAILFFVGFVALVLLGGGEFSLANLLFDKNGLLIHF